jgi:hypothetical protein
MSQENSPNKIPKYYCKKCDYKCSKLSDWTKHTSTAKHTVTSSGDILHKAKSIIYHTCVVCDYRCSKNSDFSKHLATRKHIIRTNVTKNGDKSQKLAINFVTAKCSELYEQYNPNENYGKEKVIKKSLKIVNNDVVKVPNKINIYPPEEWSNTNEETEINSVKEKSLKYNCTNCDKKYVSRNGLWCHKKRCLTKKTHPSYNEVLDIVNKDLEFQSFLIEQNKQFMEHIIKQNAQANVITTTTTTNNNNNIINNNNNTFCINVFLNEECKDALNISEFVDTIILGINELEETARLGYAPGISKIFINGLKKLDVCKRPVHCSDLKRSTLYIKNNNEWIKEQDDNINLITAIKKVANKNFKNIFEWQKLYPEYNDSSSKQSDKYHKLICNTMSGSTQEEQIHNYDKIIKNIIKEVVIEKK